MAQQLLNRPDVIPGLQQVRRKRVPKRVAGYSLLHARRPGRQSHCALHTGLVHMMPSRITSSLITVYSRRRKHPVPRELARGVGDLPCQRIRQCNRKPGIGQISAPATPRLVQLFGHRIHETLRQYRHAIFPALPRPHGHGPRLHIHVFHAQTHSLGHPQSASVHQDR